MAGLHRSAPAVKADEQPVNLILSDLRALAVSQRE